MKGRNAVALRLARMLFYLPQFQEIGAEELDRMAAWFGCSRRTVYRDIEALRAAGFKVPKTERQAA
jgi:predicted DNA-binding transcriptional regulator YafY